MTGHQSSGAGPDQLRAVLDDVGVYYVVQDRDGPVDPEQRRLLPAGARDPARGQHRQRAAAGRVQARAVVVRRTVDAMLGALAPVLPDRLPAASNGHPMVLTIGGVDPATGKSYVTAEIGTGGMGARPGMDGVESVQTDTSNAQNIPVEALELEFPLRVGHYRLRPDSGGAGALRGGLGFEKSVSVAARRGARLAPRASATTPRRGGSSAASRARSAKSAVARAGGETEACPSKLDFVLHARRRALAVDDRRRRLRRSARARAGAVLEDVLDGKVSLAAAADRYGVVVRDRELDGDATSALFVPSSSERRGPVTGCSTAGRSAGSSEPLLRVEALADPLLVAHECRLERLDRAAVGTDRARMGRKGMGEHRRSARLACSGEAGDRSGRRRAVRVR